MAGVNGSINKLMYISRECIRWSNIGQLLIVAICNSDRDTLNKAVTKYINL